MSRPSCCRSSRTPPGSSTPSCSFWPSAAACGSTKPVDWFDDPDSRVDVVGTALDDLRGVRRVRRSLAAGALPVADIAARLGRGAPGGSTWQQLQRFAAVGVASTAVHLGLFAVLSSGVGSAQVANLAALLVATVANTALNRRWTFGIHGRGAARHQLQGLVIFALTWLVTAGALGLLHLVAATAPTSVATAVVAAATAASTVARFLVMRSWIVRPPTRVGEVREPAASRRTEEGLHVLSTG